MGKKTENIVSNDPANSATGNRLQSIIDVSENWLRIQNGKDSVTKEKFCGEYKKQVLVRFRNSLISLFGTNRIDHIEDDVKKTVYNLLGTAKMFTINATDTLDSLELNRLVLTQHTMRELIK